MLKSRVKRNTGLDKPIMTFDSFGDHVNVFSSNSVSKLPMSSVNSKDDSFIVTSIKSKDLLTANVELDAKILDEDVEELVYQKAYAELALDQNADYTIRFEQDENDPKKFSVFAINSQIIENNCASIVNKTKYVDFIVAQPLLFQTLYRNNVLASDKVDCFIYIEDDDAFLALYSNGKYVYSRSIGRYSLSYIKTKTDELRGEKTTTADFLTALQNIGVSIENPQDDLSQVLEDMFLYISDSLNQISNRYGLKIQNVYIGSQVGTIPNLSKFIEDRILIPTTDFNFNVYENYKRIDKSWCNILLHMYAKDRLSNKISDELNFTVFPRPPKFVERDGGKLLLAVACALIIGLAYPLLQIVESFVLYVQTVSTQKDTEEKTIIVDGLKAQLARVETELKQVQERVNVQQQNLDIKTGILNSSKQEKSDYPMKGTVLFDLAKFVRSVSLKTVGVDIKDREVSFQVSSNDDKPITQLIKNIDSSGNYKVRTKLISLKDNAYESNITMEIK